MSYWGWRAIVSCLVFSVLITACSTPPPVPPARTASATPPLNVTLRLRLSPTPLPPSLTPRFQTPQITPRPGIGTPIAPMQFSAPTCTLTNPDALLCLGRVQNLSTGAATEVTLRLRVLWSDGRLSPPVTVQVPQRVLPPGQSAAYAARLPLTGSHVAQTQLELIHAQAAPPDSAVPPLRLRDETGTLTGDGAYHLHATLTADSAVDAPHALLTLLDADQQVVGFRVYALERLAADETRPLSLSLWPVRDYSPPLTHHLWVEGW